MGTVCITSWYPKLNGSHFGLPPYPQNDWTGWQNLVNYDVFAQAPLESRPLYIAGSNKRKQLNLV